MTVYLSIENDKLKIENTIQDAAVQFHEHLIVDENQTEDIFEHGKKTIIDNVDTNATARGNVLISGVFGPCNAVVAKLKNGEFAMYHARNGHVGVVGVSTPAKDVKNFFSSIKDEIDEIYIFQKSDPIANAAKAPELTVAMSMFANPDVKIHRLNVEGYQYVLCDSSHNHLILFKNLEIVANMEEAKKNPTLNTSCKAIDMNESISMEDTVKQVCTKRSGKK